MENIDLHTLKVLDEIYKTSSLSRTADRLGLTQPAISIALARLRKHFDDPLFVRVGNSMSPTPQTEGIMDQVREAIRALEATLNYRASFDAASTGRVFRVAMTDVGQIVVVPALLRELQVSAPSVRVEVSNISDRTPQLLESGELDLAVGFIPQIPPTFYQQALFEERFACLARSDHPRIQQHPTLAQFEAESHVRVMTSGTGHLIVDRHLEASHVQRRVAVSIPNFLSLQTIIGGSDYLCTLPRRAAQVMSRTGQVSVHDLPFELPGYTVKQHWHERQHRDDGNRWLRGALVSLFSSQG